MFGRVPLNEAYLMCQGREALRTVAEPLVHLSAYMALVMRPTRAPATFATVLVCRDPSSVNAHSKVPKPPLKLSLANVLLKVWLERDSLVADDVLTNAVSMMSAIAVDTSMRMGLTIAPHDELGVETGRDPRLDHKKDGAAKIAAPSRLQLQLQVDKTYIRVTVILVAAPSTVSAVEVPLRAPLMPQLVGDSPPMTALVRAPPASRLYTPVAVPPEARHATPKTGSLTLN